MSTTWLIVWYATALLIALMVMGAFVAILGRPMPWAWWSRPGMVAARIATVFVIGVDSGESKNV